MMWHNKFSTKIRLLYNWRVKDPDVSRWNLGCIPEFDLPLRKPVKGSYRMTILDLSKLNNSSETEIS